MWREEKWRVMSHLNMADSIDAISTNCAVMSEANPFAAMHFVARVATHDLDGFVIAKITVVVDVLKSSL